MSLAKKRKLTHRKDGIEQELQRYLVDDVAGLVREYLEPLILGALIERMPERYSDAARLFWRPAWGRLTQMRLMCRDDDWVVFANPSSGFVEIKTQFTDKFVCSKVILAAFDDENEPLLSVFDGELFTCSFGGFVVRRFSVQHLDPLGCVNMESSPESLVVLGQYLYASCLHSVTVVDKFSGKMECEWDISEWASSSIRQLAVRENCLYVKFDKEICKYE